MNSGNLIRDEFAQLAGIDLISTARTGMIRDAYAAARSLSDDIRYIEANLVLNDARPAERQAASGAPVLSPVYSAASLMKWLAKEVSSESSSYEDRHAFAELLAIAGNDAFNALEAAQDTQAA